MRTGVNHRVKVIPQNVVGAQKWLLSRNFTVGPCYGYQWSYKKVGYLRYPTLRVCLCIVATGTVSQWRYVALTTQPYMCIPNVHTYIETNSVCVIASHTPWFLVTVATSLSKGVCHVEPYRIGFTRICKRIVKTMEHNLENMQTYVNKSGLQNPWRRCSPMLNNVPRQCGVGGSHSMLIYHVYLSCSWVRPIAR